MDAKQLAQKIMDDHFPNPPAWVNINIFRDQLQVDVMGLMNEAEGPVGEHHINVQHLMFPFTSDWFDPGAAGGAPFDNVIYCIDHDPEDCEL